MNIFMKRALRVGLVAATTPIFASCVSNSETNTEALKTYNEALASVNTVYGTFATGFRRSARENALDTYRNQVAFNAIGVPGSAQMLSLLSPPDASAMLCNDQENSWWVRGAMAPLSEISTKLGGIQNAPKQTGFSLLWAASRADLTQSISKSTTYTDLAKKAVTDCNEDYVKAFNDLSGGSGNQEAALSIATLTLAFNAFKAFYAAADTLAGKFGSLVYAQKQKEAFRDFLRAPETKTAFNEAVGTLKKQWKERNKVNRSVAAEVYVVAYFALSSSNTNLIVKYGKMAKPNASSSTLKDVDNALKAQISQLLEAADAYDAAFDVGALGELKALENAFAKLVERANDDNFDLGDLNTLFAEVKSIYEQIEKTIEVANAAKAATRALANGKTPK